MIREFRRIETVELRWARVTDTPRIACITERAKNPKSSI